MGFWKELFGGGVADDLDRRSFSSAYSASMAENTELTADLYKRHGMKDSAETEYRNGKRLYDSAIQGIEEMKERAMLRPLMPSRSTFDRALAEYAGACEALAHQKLIGASDKSELAYSVRKRFNTARAALLALVFESDISKEELDRRVADLMGEAPEGDHHEQP